MTLLFFGSFNPVHSGHIAVARAALETFPKSEVYFVLSAQNPFKETKDLWDYDKRFQLLQEALKTEKGMSICQIERDLPKPSYTIDTLNLLSKKYPNKKFYLLMGQDNLNELTLWKNYKEILKRFPIVVYPREGGLTAVTPQDGEFAVKDYGLTAKDEGLIAKAEAPKLPAEAKITFLNKPLLHFSSSEIRSALTLTEN